MRSAALTLFFPLTEDSAARRRLDEVVDMPPRFEPVKMGREMGEIVRELIKLAGTPQG